MNPRLLHLLEEIESARQQFLATLENINPSQARFKPSAQEWSILEIAEHMVRAEQAGVAGMYSVIEEMREGEERWNGISANAGLSIEQIVDKTWQPREQVPNIAAPQWGGSISYWKARLTHCKQLVEDLVAYLGDLDPEKVVFPHPISGPMNVVQRLEFLRFHMDRHRAQMERVKAHPDFPD